MKEGDGFAYKPPKWLHEIKDDSVWAVTFTLLFDHQYTKTPFSEESLKKEIAELQEGRLSEEQAQEVFNLVVSHKDQF